jgi:hypothetical protein
MRSRVTPDAVADLLEGALAVVNKAEAARKYAPSRDVRLPRTWLTSERSMVKRGGVAGRDRLPVLHEVAEVTFRTRGAEWVMWLPT